MENDIIMYNSVQMCGIGVITRVKKICTIQRISVSDDFNLNSYCVFFAFGFFMQQMILA